ncbi:hypothetical protein [Moorena sp. SIO2C4]|uniref:hypothetical protein n=1 Tax=Moorena sp. SIO2C4 TaxID=2607824 RepID=UPI0013C88D1B|nr:hypothetical protein [Moorena sp. SIO2C4]NES44361.1 hypothetical protein [Moorena sp. SIO2C4]
MTHDYEKPSDFRERFRQGLSLWLENTKANSLSTVEKKSSTPNSPSTKATVQSVKTSGNWILLNNNYYLAKLVETKSDGTISVQITTNDLEEQANLKDLKPDQFSHYSPISYAYQEEALLTEVKDVILTSTGGKNLFVITLLPIQQSQENIFQDIRVGSNNGNYYSPDEIAEMRVIILLFNDDSLLSNKEDYLRVDSLINCSAGGKRIEPINFPELWKNLKMQKDKFLRIARLAAVYELKMSGIVEHILELKLGPIKNHLMTVEFRGTRMSRYKNKETKVIEVKGNCSLRD